MKSNGISSAVPTVLPAAERREAERSEVDRSVAAGRTVPAQPPALPRPDPEVVVVAKRRTFPAAYKQRVLAEADAASAPPGAIGAVLRREGRYSSHLVTWRRERQAFTVERMCGIIGSYSAELPLGGSSEPPSRPGTRRSGFRTTRLVPILEIRDNFRIRHTS